MGNILKKKIWYDKKGNERMIFADTKYPDRTNINLYERRSFIEDIDTYKLINKQISKQVFNDYKLVKKGNDFAIDCKGTENIYIANENAIKGADTRIVKFTGLKGYIISTYEWWDGRVEIETISSTVKGFISTKDKEKEKIRALEYIRVLNENRFEEYFKMTSCISCQNTVMYNVKNIDSIGDKEQEDITLQNVANVNNIKSKKILVKLEGIGGGDDIDKLELKKVECDKLTIAYYLQYKEVHIGELKVRNGSVDETEVFNSSEKEYLLGTNTHKLTIDKFEDTIVGTLKLTDISNFEIKDFQGIELNINWTIREHKRQLSKADIEAIKEMKARIHIKTATGNTRKIKLEIKFPDVYEYWKTNFYKIKVGDNDKYEKEGDVQKGIKRMVKEYIEIVNETSDEVQFSMNYNDNRVGGTKDWSDLVRNIRKGKA